jgi:hypothetical protein
MDNLDNLAIRKELINEYERIYFFNDGTILVVDKETDKQIGLYQ